MTTTLLPQAFWFRLGIPCKRLDGLPKTGSKQLLNLPEACRLPQTARLDGLEPWAGVRVAWNSEGLAVSVDAQGKIGDLGSEDRPEGQYGLLIWVDTRDTRDVSRATRFCHRFDARLVKGLGKSGVSVKVQQRAIARAVADAPLAKTDAVAGRAEVTKNGWRLEVFLPASVLNGFDPDTNRRLGFNYLVLDPDKVPEALGVGREFPVGENPSLWSTLELVDAK